MKRTMKELAEFWAARSRATARRIVSGVAAPASARAEDLIYVESPRHLERAAASAARCAVIAPGLALAGKDIAACGEPKAGICARGGVASAPRSHREGIHPTAVIAPSAQLAPGVAVGPYAVIEEDVRVGAGTEIGAFCFLGRGARLGEGCRLYPRVTLYAGARLANRVILHSGAVIGSDGFGYVAEGGKATEISTGGRGRNSG